MSAQDTPTGADADLLAALADVPAEQRETTAERVVELEQLVRKWNRAFNLVSRQDLHRLRSRHVLDSLQALPLVSGTRLLDLGSGGGFPGLPLAIARPDISVTLLDSSERKTRFLRQALIELRLDNAEVVCARAEQLAAPDGARWDTIVARAVADATQVVRWAQPLCQPGGRLVIFAPMDNLPVGHIVTERKYRTPGIDGTRAITVVQFDSGAV